MYKELEAIKIMRENEQQWRYCEGVRAAFEEARTTSVEAQSTAVAAEEKVEECRQKNEHIAKEVRHGERLIDIPLYDTDLFMKGIFGA